MNATLEAQGQRSAQSAVLRRSLEISKRVELFNGTEANFWSYRRFDFILIVLFGVKQLTH